MKSSKAAAKKAAKQLKATMAAAMTAVARHRNAAIRICEEGTNNEKHPMGPQCTPLTNSHGETAMKSRGHHENQEVRTYNVRTNASPTQATTDEDNQPTPDQNNTKSKESKK